MHLEIIRLTRDFDAATFGVLTLDKLPFCVTLERPDRKNAPSDGCIPAGEYECQRSENRKLPNGQVLAITYEVLKVPLRAGILFHPGNSIHDTKGCIILAEAFAGGGYVAQSRAAFKRFFERLNGEQRFTLHIRYLPELY